MQSLSLGDLPSRIDSLSSIHIRISISNNEIHPIQNLMTKLDSDLRIILIKHCFYHFLIKFNFFDQFMIDFDPFSIRIWLYLIHFLLKCQLNNPKWQKSIDFFEWFHNFQLISLFSLYFKFSISTAKIWTQDLWNWKWPLYHWANSPLLYFSYCQMKQIFNLLSKKQLLTWNW